MSESLSLDQQVDHQNPDHVRHIDGQPTNGSKHLA
jgi:hypothetical protein